MLGIKVTHLRTWVYFLCWAHRGWGRGFCNAIVVDFATFRSYHVVFVTLPSINRCFLPLNFPLFALHFAAQILSSTGQADRMLDMGFEPEIAKILSQADPGYHGRSMSTLKKHQKHVKEPKWRGKRQFLCVQTKGLGLSIVSGLFFVHCSISLINMLTCARQI